MGFSLRVKLLSLSGLMALFLLIVGGISRFQMNQVVEKFDHVASIDLPNTMHLAEMHKAFKQARVELRTLAISDLPQKQIEDYIAGFQNAVERYDKANTEYRNVKFVEGEEALYQQVDQTWAEFKKEAIDIAALAKKGGPDSHAVVKAFVLNVCPRVAGEYEAHMGKLLAFEMRQASYWSGEAKAGSERANTTVAFVIFGGLAVSLALGAWFSSQLATQIRAVVEKLSAGAEQIAQASQEISSSSDSLSSAATQQAASLQETSASVQEMSSMVARNAENADSARDTSGVSREKAQEGETVVREMIEAIHDIEGSTNDIGRQMDESNKELAEIIKVIAEIQDKTKVINDIVFQTKLLSFNASVEAARAGEHGKGFAVVAEEVGSLAQMSGNASTEISNLLTSSLSKVESTIRSSQDRVQSLLEISRKKVGAGTAVANRCGETLAELVRTANEVNRMADEIAAASQEQASGIQEINKAMHQLDQGTQQTSASAEQAAQASGELAHQANSLREVVSVLKQTVDGSRAEVRSGVSASASSDRSRDIVLAFNKSEKEFKNRAA